MLGIGGQQNSENVAAMLVCVFILYSLLIFEKVTWMEYEHANKKFTMNRAVVRREDGLIFRNTFESREATGEEKHRHHFYASKNGDFLEGKDIYATTYGRKGRILPTAEEIYRRQFHNFPDFPPESKPVAGCCCQVKKKFF